jgi:drug/metabolite transporter (DMT)-like permease
MDDRSTARVLLVICGIVVAAGLAFAIFADRKGWNRLTWVGLALVAFGLTAGGYIFFAPLEDWRF